jgi:heme-degrading monooxygenase HmoA
MFARVSRYSGDTALLREGFDSVTAELERLDGFRDALFLVDPAHQRAVTITLWEDQQALDASAEAAHAMRTRATEPASATVESVEHYEVSQEVRPAGLSR